MDSLTHLVAGALTPLAFRHTPKRAAVVAFGMIAGSLPDIDVLFGGSPEALLSLHRGVTHAFFWQPLFVLILVLPFYFWLRRHPLPFRRPGAGQAGLAGSPGPTDRAGLADRAELADRAAPGGFTFGRIYVVALAATCIHIYLDCMTTFGTQALLPFSARRVALPAMFIVDLLLTVPLIILLVAALRQPPEAAPALSGKSAEAVQSPVYSARARRLARFGLAWALLYPLASLGVNTLATVLLEPSLTAAPVHGSLSGGEKAPDAAASAHQYLLDTEDAEGLAREVAAGEAETGGAWRYLSETDRTPDAPAAPGQAQNTPAAPEDAVPEDAVSEDAVPNYTRRRLQLLTEPFSPFVWKAVVDEGKTYRLGTITLLRHGPERMKAVYAKPDPQLYASLARQVPLFALFEDFSANMVEIRRPAAPGVQKGWEEPIYESAFVDLRYLMSPDSPARWLKRTDPNFVLEARLTGTGELLAYRFLHRGRHLNTPWTLVR